MKTYEIGQIIQAKFAVLNKNDTLEEYIEECELPQYTKKDYLNYPGDDGLEKNWDIETCKIEQIFYVTKNEWNKITNNFLDDNIIFRKKGGNVYIGTNEKIINTNDVMDIYNDEKLMNEFRNNSARLVTLIQNEDGNCIVVDPQGHDYARYVGVEVTN
jgi:hypothetical protein